MPDNAHLGVCTVTRFDDITAPLRHRLRIDQADELIRITDELLASLEERGWAGEGGFLIEAENGTVLYRLLDHDDYWKQWTARRIGPDPSAAPSALGDKDTP